MKRVIREVVTLIRIERWIVEEDDLQAALSADEASSLPGAAVEVIIEEIVEQPPAPKRRRELFRRVLSVEELGDWGSGTGEWGLGSGEWDKQGRGAEPPSNSPRKNSRRGEDR